MMELYEHIQNMPQSWIIKFFLYMHILKAKDVQIKGWRLLGRPGTSCLLLNDFQCNLCGTDGSRVSRYTLIQLRVLDSRTGILIKANLHLLLASFKLHRAEWVNRSLRESIVFLYAFNPVIHLLLILTFILYINIGLLSSSILTSSYFHSFSCVSSSSSRAWFCSSKDLIVY
jgi:hypothetical protein